MYIPSPFFLFFFEIFIEGGSTAYSIIYVDIKMASIKDTSKAVFHKNSILKRKEKKNIKETSEFVIVSTRRPIINRVATCRLT
jgi:hypothetical protein